MSGKIEISRETLENSLKDGSSDPVVYASYRKAVADIRALLAAPVVERQPDAYMTVNPNGMKALFFPSKNIEPSPLDRPLYTSPPAPVSVVLPTILSSEQGPHYSDNRTSELGYLAGYNACLDKVKELNYQGHASDCSTNNRGVPELLGPCDCDLSKKTP